jgi:hypothetical protein
LTENPRFPPPPPPLERPLFDLVTEWAQREENRSIALTLGVGVFSGAIFWLLWALK